ncbi:carotenoid oxygenase family protein [Reyranella sp.]|jgi:all-trans-8'-apo-beta-carotenal 15,15'-oxygenase|uniref:carotenoid oxygenase family protein n=1 Tax=Reyranella sp. TaxID=1929291 RepID=UPI002F92755C
MAVHPWSGGFRSLADEFDYRVEDIDGEVPASLRGTLFRNGSGRNELDGRWFAHWFDGDGMIQAIRFDADGIRYRNRYVVTASYRDETRTGRILYRGFGKMRPGGVLANMFREPANVSNTSVVVESGRLLSLWEGGPPYELDRDTLRTKGVADFGGVLRAFSAHPKIDPESGELFNFGIDYGRKTTLTPYRLHRGKATALPAVTLPHPLMNHDFVLTRHHLVFCLGPILVRSLKMMVGLASFDRALHWDSGKPTLILLVPRDGKGPLRTIETDPFFQFHFANGYEEDGAIVLDLARYPDFAVIGQALRDFWRSDWPAEGMANLTRLRVDLASGRVDMRSFTAGTANEFPTINPACVGRRHRFAYFACNPAGHTMGLQQQIAKVDLERGTVTAHDFGPGGYPGEAVFIPTGGAEDDGILVTLVFDSTTERSAIVGLDARDLGARPLFTARLKHHVPYGLHGFFAPCS